MVTDILAITIGFAYPDPIANCRLDGIAIPTTCAALLLFSFAVGLRPNSYGLIVAMVFQRPIRQGVELLMLEMCRPIDRRWLGAYKAIRMLTVGRSTAP